MYGIIDDQADYYNLNDTWLTKEEKKKLEERERKRQEEKENRKNRITIDFAGRRIVANEEQDFQFEKEMTEVAETLRDKKLCVYFPFHVTHMSGRLLTSERERERQLRQRLLLP